MKTVTIYGFEPSTYTQTALLVAAEAGVPAEIAPLEFKKPSHFKLHPYGKMPVLQHRDVTLFETLAIAMYLDRVFGGSRLQPSDAVDHARMLQWISVAVDYAYEDLVARLLEDEPAADAVGAAGEQLKLLDSLLGDKPWFAGEPFSLADLFFYPMVEFAGSKLGQSCFKSLPALTRWKMAVSNRIAARKAA